MDILLVLGVHLAKVIGVVERVNASFATLSSYERVLEQVRESRPMLVILEEIARQSHTWMELVSGIRETSPDIQIVFLSSNLEADSASLDPALRVIVLADFTSPDDLMQNLEQLIHFDGWVPVSCPKSYSFDRPPVDE